MHDSVHPIDSIGHEIKAIDHLMQRKMLSSAAKSGVDKVTIMHGWIIGYLYCNKDNDIFQKDIESEFAISRSTVTNILNLMEKKGYVVRKSVKSDARLKKITLTKNGIEMFMIIQNAIAENERTLNSLLSDDERLTLLSLIRKLRKNLEEI